MVVGREDLEEVGEVEEVGDLEEIGDVERAEEVVEEEDLEKLVEVDEEVLKGAVIRSSIMTTLHSVCWLEPLN